MAKTLIIKNVDFSANKIETVSFGQKPCTGIVINDESYDLTAIGATQNVDYTVTPSDTSDTILWASSDTTVATVSNGVITAIGLGTATITVTCGNFSDTVDVEVAEAFNPHWTIGSQAISTSGSEQERFINKVGLSDGFYAGSLAGTYPINGTSDPYVYPYKIPNGSVKIRVQAPNYYIGIAWSNLAQTEYSSKAIGLGGNSASSSSGVADDYTYEIPSGVDSFALTIRRKDWKAATEGEQNNVTVTFLTE